MIRVTGKQSLHQGQVELLPAVVYLKILVVSITLYSSLDLS